MVGIGVGMGVKVGSAVGKGVGGFFIECLKFFSVTQPDDTTSITTRKTTMEILKSGRIVNHYLLPCFDYSFL